MKAITLIEQEDKAAFDALVDGVRQYNHSKLGTESSKPLTLVVKDEQQCPIAGIGCRTIYQQLLIEVLWVDESLRGTGIGSELMIKAEEIAKQRGCIGAQVDTLGCQAPLFYQKHGFNIVGKIDGITADHDRYFLSKHFK